MIEAQNVPERAGAPRSSATSPIADRQLALLRVARGKLGLSKTKFREIVRTHGGVNGVSRLDQAGFQSVLACLRRMGFKYRRRSVVARERGAST